MKCEPQVGDVVLYSDGEWYRINRVLRPVHDASAAWYELVTT